MTISDQPPPEAPSSSRSWWLAGLAFVLSLGAFFIPQEIPLEWYPLNEPGTDIHYLEIKCASDADGWVTIWYDITHGWSDIDQIRFPISPTEQTYTYTFPLPDAPMIGLRLDPIAQGGTLRVHHMRIINRRSEEIQHFPIESLSPVQHIAKIEPLETGWAITSTDDAIGPITVVESFRPLLPVDMNKRNLYRCLLSTGYLAGMLVILMLAVTCAFWRPKSWKDFLGHVLLLIAIAIPFSAVGNRGLIRNSISYARFDPTSIDVPLQLQMRAQTDRMASVQLFWDTGEGESEADSSQQIVLLAPHAQFIRLPLPREPVRSLRLDPLNHAGTISVTDLRLVRGVDDHVANLPVASFEPRNDIASLQVADDTATIITDPEATDPILQFTPEAVEAINAAVAQEAE